MALVWVLAYYFPLLVWWLDSSSCRCSMLNNISWQAFYYSWSTLLGSKSMSSPCLYGHYHDAIHQWHQDFFPQHNNPPRLLLLLALAFKPPHNCTRGWARYLYFSAVWNKITHLFPRLYLHLKFTSRFLSGPSSISSKLMPVCQSLTTYAMRSKSSWGLHTPPSPCYPHLCHLEGGSSLHEYFPMSSNHLRLCIPFTTAYADNTN